ncbi:MAG: LacI family DNA-binding transcriptional regulator [Leifsonia sp.]
MQPATDVVTLQDVADRASVSRATASLALSGKGRMTPATRQRVRDAAEELDYVVNVTARNLRSSRSGAIGLYVPDHTLSFRYYMDVAFGAVEEAQASDLLVTLMPTAFAPRSGITEHLDGFIMIDPIDDDPIVERLLNGRSPVVSGEQSPSSMPAPYGTVYGDHYHGIRLLLDHLWENGSRRPACLLPDRSIAWGRGMQDGYRDWCVDRGVEMQALIGTFQTTTEEARDLIEGLLSGSAEVDGLITAPEGTALIALDAIRAAGLELGRDLLLASYVDSDSLALTDPSVTALDLQPREFGRQCMMLLADALNGRSREGESVEVAISVIARRSTQRISAN